jgi:hypothetical protein
MLDIASLAGLVVTAYWVGFLLGVLFEKRYGD